MTVMSDVEDETDMRTSRGVIFSCVSILLLLLLDVYLAKGEDALKIANCPRINIVYFFLMFQISRSSILICTFFENYNMRFRCTDVLQ